MVTNTLLTIDMITEEALVVLKNSFVLGRTCLRQFDPSFGKEGAKIGDTLRIRIPVRVTSVTGPAASPQNTTETKIPLAIQTQRHTDFQYTTKDLALSLDDFSETVIKPAMAQLASDIDQDGMATIIGGTIAAGAYAGSYSGINALATPGTYVAGTPAQWTGDDLSTLRPFLDARALLKMAAAPDDNHKVLINPFASAGVVDSLKSLFQSSTQISEQYLKGYMGTTAGFEFNESQNLPVFTAGTREQTGGVVTTTSTEGDSTLAVTISGTQTVVQGDQFTVAGVYAVNPLNRTSTGKLAMFVATATVAAVGGAIVIPVSLGQAAGPAISASGQYQTVSALPQSGAAVTFMGAAGATTQVNIAYSPQAFALGVASLADVGDEGAMCYTATDEDAGLELRYVYQYSAQTDLSTRRVDILYGWQLVRPSLAVRIQA